MKHWRFLLVLLVIVVAPLFASKGFALSLLSRIGIMALFALSYNMLLGETGLLSFGHAVYYGLGSFATLHVLNGLSARGLPAPVTLLPLAGGLAALLFGLVFGYPTTRRAGTTFAMISLGIGEMVAASSLMFPAFFGGEAGISGNRVTGKGLFGIDYGTPLQVYYLIAFWVVVCAIAIRALSGTPLGRLANAVRDNPLRVEFVGYNPTRVRYLMVVLAGFFAGVAGGLNALRAEIVTAEALSDYTSGIVILMAFTGGIGRFYGPILGAVVVTVLQVAVASVTPAWPFYFGLFFVLIVLYAPGGIASLLERRWQPRTLALAAGPALLLLFGIIGAVEMAYARSSDTGDARLRIVGIPLDGESRLSWVFVAAAVAAGIVLLKRVRREPAVGLQ
ncbi:MAG TPA: branched-chain amino acid ABC transporter permease [Myxococcales bacterium]|jgi:branched-chain amino acid transport system permease protein